MITKSTGAWIFVSHSHRDLDKVRQIRDELEKRGHNPLLFFLKCLNDDDARLPELIRDEIKARNWFVLCDSHNARASKYVPEEVAIVMAEKGKGFETIDLEQDLESQFYKLDRICKRATVFLSYSRSTDIQVAEEIRRSLLKHDYSVWIDQDNLKAGMPFDVQLQSAIDEAVTRGFVLLLLSPASLTSQWCKHETEYALELAARSQRSNVIPVVIAPFARETLPRQLANLQWFDLTNGPLEERIRSLINDLKTREME